eukprot:SAG11_NODE_3040_length_2740_cov_15.737978_4_plen_85_part_00
MLKKHLLITCTVHDQKPRNPNKTDRLLNFSIGTLGSLAQVVVIWGVLTHPPQIIQKIKKSNKINSTDLQTRLRYAFEGSGTTEI